MVAHRLADVKDNFKVSGCATIKGVKICGSTLADNALTCDSIGNCMLTDELMSAYCAKTGQGCRSSKLADNSLICDADGNCMLKDALAYRP